MMMACSRVSSPLLTLSPRRLSTASKSWATANPSGSKTRAESSTHTWYHREFDTFGFLTMIILNLLSRNSPPLISLTTAGGRTTGGTRHSTAVSREIAQVRGIGFKVDRTSASQQISSMARRLRLSRHKKKFPCQLDTRKDCSVCFPLVKSLSWIFHVPFLSLKASGIRPAALPAVAVMLWL